MKNKLGIKKERIYSMCGLYVQIFKKRIDFPKSKAFICLMRFALENTKYWTIEFCFIFNDTLSKSLPL